MNCEKTLSRLPLFAGGDLDLRDQAAVEGHLEHCLPCYREYRRQAELLERVQRAATWSAAALPPLGDAFTASVMGRIDGPPPLPRLLPRVVMVSGWAAALFLGVFLAWGPVVGRGGPADDGAAGAADPSSELTDAMLTTTPAAWSIPDELLTLPGGAVPLHKVADPGLDPDPEFNQVERLILDNRFGSTPVSYPSRLRDY